MFGFRYLFMFIYYLIYIYYIIKNGKNRFSWGLLPFGVSIIKFLSLLFIHTQLIKKKLGQYLSSLENYEFFCKKNGKNRFSWGLFPFGVPILFATALLLTYTNPLKKKVSPYLSRFSNFALYKFVTSYARTHGRTHGRTDELLDHNTSSRPKGPRAKMLKF